MIGTIDDQEINEMEPLLFQLRAVPTPDDFTFTFVGSSSGEKILCNLVN